MSAARRVIAIVGVAACVGVGLWLFLWARTDGVPRDDVAARATDDASPPPSLAPSPAPLPPKVAKPTPADAVTTGPASPAKVALVVRGEDDKPVAGAVVHARRKIVNTDDRLRAIGTTDADGKWPVAIALAGEWVAVTSPGRVPAFVDGDRVDASRDTSIRLEAGGVVEATVVEADDRTPVAHATVFVELPREAEGEDDAADERTGLSSWERADLVRASATTGDDGRAVVKVGIAGPVHVEVRPPNWNLVVDPSAVELPNSTGSARFRLLPGCKLVLRAIDDATGAPLAVPFMLRRWLEGSPENFVGSSFTNPDKTGVFDFFPGLVAGRHVLRATADGYEPWTSEPVVLDRPGASATVEARMKRAAAPRWGRIRLTLRKPVREGVPWYERKGSGERGPTFQLRRTSPNPTNWGRSVVVRAPLGFTIDEQAIRAGPETWDAERRVLEISDVEPARYAILVLDRSTWSVGGIADLEVLPDSSTDREVDLVAGVRVTIAAIVGHAPSVRGIRLFDERGTEWPAVVLGYGSMVTYDAESRIPAGVVLDPVPAARVRVAWRGADGADHEQWLPEAK